MKIVMGQNDRLGPWMVARQQYAEWIPGSGQTIGLLSDDDEPIAVAAFDQYNEANINIHIAAVPGKRWATPNFLWYCFYYPFIQLGVKRVTGIVASTNLAARRFDEHIGFTLEATLKDAHPDGDLLVYCMTKDQCRWLNYKDRSHVKTESPSSP